MLLLLLLASPAVADDWYPRVTGGAGIGLRAGDIAVARTNGPSFTVQAEVKATPTLFVGAAFDVARASTFEGPEVTITTQTAQVGVRTVLLGWGDKPKKLGGDMFASAGIAREWNQWSDGALARNLIVLGAGTALLLPHDETARQVRAGLRLQLSRAPSPGKAAPGCDGPCDTPTTTQPYDLAMLLEVSCHVGR